MIVTIGRRELPAALGGATAWPLATRAQRPERMRRIGVLMSTVEGDQSGLEYVTAFAQGPNWAGPSAATCGSNTAGAPAISIAFTDTLRSWSCSRRMWSWLRLGRSWARFSRQAAPCRSCS
jgi:hypothetical protein